MTEAQLAAIRAREAAATPGPWTAEYDHDEPVSDWGMEVLYAEERNAEDYAKAVWDGDICRATSITLGPGPAAYGVDGVQERDAIFCAHARTDVPALLAALAASQAQAARLEQVALAAVAQFYDDDYGRAGGFDQRIRLLFELRRAGYCTDLPMPPDDALAALGRAPGEGPDG